jgi:nicotinate-nucleotide adenylyltransferase
MQGVLGGSFDPIHEGHIQIALEAFEKLGLSAIRIIPCGKHPDGKVFHFSDDERVRLIEEKLKEFGTPLPRNPSDFSTSPARGEVIYPFIIDRREINSDKISYTLDTLVSLKKEFPGESFAFIIGMDVWNQIATWRDVKKLAALTNLIVAKRPHYLYQSEAEAFFTRANTREAFLASPAGSYFLLDNPENSLSSTDIRSALKG